MVLVALQVLLGLYLPPVSRIFVHGIPEHPPQTIISLPVHTAVCIYRAVGALVSVVGVQESSVELCGAAMSGNVYATPDGSAALCALVRRAEGQRFRIASRFVL